MELKCLDQEATDERCYSKISSMVATFSNDRSCSTSGTTCYSYHIEGVVKLAMHAQNEIPCPTSTFGY